MKQYAEGLILVSVLAIGSMIAAPIIGHSLSPLLLAIVVGMVLGNTFYPRYATRCEAGVTLAKSRILRLAIILYGFRLTFAEVAHLGAAVLLLDVIMVFSTFMLALWLGRRLFGLDRDSAMLIGAGASICGAAAVLAVEPLLKSPAYKVSVAVATVVLFGTIAMLVYPLMYSLGWLPFSADVFGVYIGASVHEVAQVVAAGGVVSPEVADTAVLTKMTRVMLLAPFLLFLSWMLARADGHDAKKRHIAVPWFALWFLVMIGVHSLGILPQWLVDALVWIDTLLLTMAMAALGLTTRFKEMAGVGAAPFALALSLFAWLVIGGGLLTWLLV
ncbi:YeiH family protein [Suttonella sp. R2A3]|uniref:YeiH family protein n=1 Tax=Suttonella sp. R2A3 TaxID=2908648 RepID=UPI001F3690ED|nr:YeiH family protein [Suttonella sp. R2A3]UJF24349.1 YeiH family protein [Suttonella sp. R2A3]